MRSKTLLLFILTFLLVQTVAFPEGDENQYVTKIQSLEDSYQKSQNANLEKQLAQAYLDYAHFLKEEKRYKEAKDYSGMAKSLGADVPDAEEEIPEEPAPIAQPALEPMPNPEGFLMQRGIVYNLLESGANAYKEKNYSLAEEQMKKALERDPSNKFAHELLGDIYYLTQNLPEAKVHWEKALSAENMQRVNIKLAKLKKEMPVESKLKSAEEEHFIIRYDRTQKEYSSYQLKTILRESYKTIYQDMGAPLEEKTIVLLYDPEVFNKSVKTEHWSGALFDGKIRVPMKGGEEKNLEGSREFKKLVQHELCHVFVFEIAGKNVPLWVHEGLAQYEENKIIPVNTDLFRATLNSGKYYKISQLNLGSKLFKDDKSILLFYQESYIVMNYLIKQYGFYKVREMLKAIQKGDSFDSAFLSTFNLSPDEMDKKWIIWADKNL